MAVFRGSRPIWSGPDVAPGSASTSMDGNPGRHRLMARATDERRLRQPAVAEWNGKGYGQNGIHCVEVIVDEDPAPIGPKRLEIDAPLTG